MTFAEIFYLESKSLRSLDQRFPVPWFLMGSISHFCFTIPVQESAIHKPCVHGMDSKLTLFNRHSFNLSAAIHGDCFYKLSQRPVVNPVAWSKPKAWASVDFVFL